MKCFSSEQWTQTNPEFFFLETEYATRGFCSLRLISHLSHVTFLKNSLVRCLACNNSNSKSNFLRDVDTNVSYKIKKLKDVNHGE